MFPFNYVFIERKRETERERRKGRAERGRLLRR